LINPLILLAIGIFVGLYGGIMGLAGGTIMIPIMVLVLGFSQHQAIGTSLAVMLPPVTLPAVIHYYREGHVRLDTAAWIALGFIFGALIGSHIAQQFSDRTLKLIFGFILVYVAGYTIFETLGKQHLLRSILFAAILTLAAFAFYSATRWYDQNHPAATPPSVSQHPPATP
jgi:uncharacterized membrane protein YfcA